MHAAIPQIVAFGGGGFSMESQNTLLDDHVLSLTRAERPKVCFIPTASGDADHYVVRFYRAFSPAVCEPSHVSLFRRDRGAGSVEGDLEAHLLAQDLIYVGGGSGISLLGAWRAHGLDDILRLAYRSGVLLCGLSAGSLCWFAEAVTAFHGAPPRMACASAVPAWKYLPPSDAGPPYRRRELLSGSQQKLYSQLAEALQALGGTSTIAAKLGTGVHFRFEVPLLRREPS